MLGDKENALIYEECAYHLLYDSGEWNYSSSLLKAGE